GAVLGTALVTVTIQDLGANQAGALQFAASNYAVAEDAGAVEIVVSRGGGSTGVATVHYATSDGTATSGADYAAAAGTLTFANNESSQSLFIPILNNLAAEGPEMFTVTLSAPTGGASL